MQESRPKNSSSTKGRRGRHTFKVRGVKMKEPRRKSKKIEQHKTPAAAPSEVLFEPSNEPFPPEFDLHVDDDDHIFIIVNDLKRKLRLHQSDSARCQEHRADLFQRMAVHALEADRLYCYLSFVKEMSERKLKNGEHFLESVIEELEDVGLSSDEQEVTRLQGKKAEMIKKNEAASLKVDRLNDRLNELSRIRNAAYSLFQAYLTEWFYNPFPINESSQGRQMKIKLYGYDHPGLLIDDRDVAVLQGGYLSLSEAIILLTPYTLPGSNMQFVHEDGTVMSNDDHQFICCSEKDTVLLYKLEKTDFYSVMFAAQRFMAQYFRQDTFPDVLGCGAAIDIETMDKEGFIYRFIQVGLNSKSSTSGATSDRIDPHFRLDLFCVPVVKEFRSATKAY